MKPLGFGALITNTYRVYLCGDIFYCMCFFLQFINYMYSARRVRPSDWLSWSWPPHNIRYVALSWQLTLITSLFHEFTDGTETIQTKYKSGSPGHIFIQQKSPTNVSKKKGRNGICSSHLTPNWSARVFCWPKRPKEINWELIYQYWAVLCHGTSLHNISLDERLYCKLHFEYGKKIMKPIIAHKWQCKLPYGIL